jgi:hypothetical protein
VHIWGGPGARFLGQKARVFLFFWLFEALNAEKKNGFLSSPLLGRLLGLLHACGHEHFLISYFFTVRTNQRSCSVLTTSAGLHEPESGVSIKKNAPTSSQHHSHNGCAFLLSVLSIDACAFYLLVVARVYIYSCPN